MTFGTLRALHTSIGNAIDDLERLYQERSPLGEPIEFPRPDVPYYSAEKHAPSDELAEKLSADPAVTFVAQQIVAACDQLGAAVNRPWNTLIRTIQEGQLVASLRFLEAAHIVEILREAGPQGLHVREICRLVAELRPKSAAGKPENLTSTRLAHILRTLATAHWLREVSPDVFANNRMSVCIDSGKTLDQLRADPSKKYVDTDGSAAAVTLFGSEGFKIVAYLTEWLLPDTRNTDTSPDARWAIRQTSKGADVRASTEESSLATEAQYATAFSLAYGTELSFYEWQTLPENSARLERFGHAMRGTRQWETTGEVLQAFPWSELAPDAVLVDVAGGIGSTSLAVAAAYPNVRAVVEDRPQVVENAPSSCSSEQIPFVESGRVSWRERDMFAPWVPLPAGGVPDVFLIRLVLQDWKEEDTRRILGNLRSAAGPNTKLIIGGRLLPHACPGDEALVGGDSPLLPNLGTANADGYYHDLLMMAVFGSQERTVSELADVALSAGWKTVVVKRVPGSLWAYTTAVPV